MACLSLRIKIVDNHVTKTIQFSPDTSVFDACRIIRDKISEADLGQPKDYGLFLADDANKGVWLEPGRNLDYYLLRNGDQLDYKKKIRTLKVKTLDGTIKTLLVDDSQPVSSLMVVICTKIGIANHEEYGLVREDLDNQENVESKANFGTLTLRRKRDEKDRDLKMEQLRKKLHTDDDINWVDPSKTLREQGIDETEPVLLKRKYFFSDQNIDARDPVQLNLLYVQARDAILNGTHPVTQDNACEFAGLQCQIQFGDYVESKHKPGFLDLKEFLPQSYIKAKQIEKKIFAEHKKHQGVSELDAKVLYTKSARALKTYGVTFFLVKEKMKGKNKLVPRLLGVTKDSVLRLDEKTKEILKTWPLTTVRRWGASPNTFTLDFGDYSDQYYSVQTTEAEQILQLIAGYIDIILKKKKSKDYFADEGDESSTMIEDSVSPLRATILQHEPPVKSEKVNTESIAKPVILRSVDDGARPVVAGSVTTTQYTMISGQINMAHTPPSTQETRIASVLSDPKKALMSSIKLGRDVLYRSESQLENRESLNIGGDLASKKWVQKTLHSNRQMVSSQLAAMNAATAQVVTLTSGQQQEMDHNAVGAAINTISSSFPEMTKGVKTIVALMDDHGSRDSLLDATKKLCCAFSDLLKATEPETKEPRQSLLSAASRVGEASHQVLYTIGEETEQSKELQDALLTLAKSVANTTANLVLKARNIAGTCETQQDQNRVIGGATQCALATSQLVACAKVVASTLMNSACQDQMIAAVKQVAISIENLISLCSQLCHNEQFSEDLHSAAAEVSRALNDLLDHIKLANQENVVESAQESSVEAVLLASDKLFASSGNSTEMVKQAGYLGQATTQLIHSIKIEAEKYPESESKRKLLAAAKTLADATAKMVEAARMCASQPNDLKRQNELRKAAEELRDITNITATTPTIRNKLVNNLYRSVRETISISTQCLTAAHASAQYNNSENTKEELQSDCEYLAEYIPSLIDAVKQVESNVNDASAQFYLIDEAEQFLQPASRLVQTARAVLPTLNDQAMSAHLSTASQKLATTLIDLKTTLNRTKMACHGHGLDAALHILTNLREDLQECYNEVEKGDLRPLPGDHLDKNSQQLSTFSKAVGHEIAQMLSAAQQNNETYTSQAARNTAYNLKSFAIAARGVAATTSNFDVKRRIILSAQDVMINTLHLIEEAKSSLNNPNGKISPNLVSMAKEVASCLNRCVNCLPSQKDIDQAITQIKEMNVLSENNALRSSGNKSFAHLQQELNIAATKLNDASTKIVSSIHNAAEVAHLSKYFSVLLKELQFLVLEIAGQTKDSIVCNKIVTCIKTISSESITLLTTAKSVSADLSSPNGKNQLAAAARAITESINQLIDVCTSTAPGQIECENAIRKIQAMKPILDNPNEAVSDVSYYECLDIVMDKSRNLGEGITGITNFAKKADYAAFGEAVKSFSQSICSLIETSAQAAYLIGVSDSSSTSSKPGLVDQNHFSRTIEDIKTGCKRLTSPLSGQEQVISAAELIAKRTSALCNVCRVASSKTANARVKKQFIESVKDVANSTSTLVKEIKLFDFKCPEKSRENCEKATKPLLEAVENLSEFCSRSEYASIPAKISQLARKSQEPIIESGIRIIEESSCMIGSAKSLILSPRDPVTWQSLANHSKHVSDSFKKLVNSIKEKAPGKKECETAISSLQSLLHALDNASMEIVSQSLVTRKGTTLQNCFHQIEQSSAEILYKLEPVRHAAKHETENIGHSVIQMLQYFEPLVTGCIGAASNMVQSNQQILIVNQAKSITESSLQLFYATKDCGGNPKAINYHGTIDESVKQTREALNELVSHVEKWSTQNGIVTGVIDSLNRSMTSLNDHRASFLSDFNMSENYVDYQTRMVANAKEIAKIAQEISNKAHSSEQSKLGPMSADLSHFYAKLAKDSMGACACACVINESISTTLKDLVQSLGSCCITLVNMAAAAAASQCHATEDEAVFREIVKHSRIVCEKVSQVLATLQSGSRGTQACIDAVSTVSGIIGDLDTTIMFATAGTLNADHENETFSNHRENILKTAKALVEDTKTLVAGAASSQEQLAVAAQNAVATILQLASVVKHGAASLGSGNPDSQVMLINAVKDVASALADLIHATKAASGKPVSDPAMSHLKDSAKVMVTNVTSLLKTVKAVEDEHTRGTRALESTIEAITQEIRNLLQNITYKQGVTVEDFFKSTKSVTQATVKAVAAGNSNKQDDIIAAANFGRKAIFDMLTISKANAFLNTENPEMRKRVLETAKETAETYRDLLTVILQENSADVKSLLITKSRKIAQCVTELIAIAELLKGTDFERNDDAILMAENELLGAAASIDAAVQKLAAIKPRDFAKENENSINYDEMILESAKSIAASTSTLVKAASVAQRELIESGKVSRRPLTSSDDGQWSEGLISAARMVAAATHSLVESANALVQGISSEEKLVSSAKQVASSTAQLLVACKVKADSNSDSMKKLQLAGNTVIKSTDNLVRAVQHSLNHDEQRSLILNRRIVGGIAQEIDARSEVIRIEKQLIEARGKLTAIRQAKYKLRTGDASGDDSDLNCSSMSANCDSNSTSRCGKEVVDLNLMYNNKSFSRLESPIKVNNLDRNRSNYQPQQPHPHLLQAQSQDDSASFESYATDCSSTSEASSKFHYYRRKDEVENAIGETKPLSPSSTPTGFCSGKFVTTNFHSPESVHFRTSTPIRNGDDRQQMFSCVTNYHEVKNYTSAFQESSSQLQMSSESKPKPKVELSQ